MPGTGAVQRDQETANREKPVLLESANRSAFFLGCSLTHLETDRPSIRSSFAIPAIAAFSIFQDLCNFDKLDKLGKLRGAKRLYRGGWKLILCRAENLMHIINPVRFCMEI